MRAIYKRELQSFFYTPVAYVFMGVFLLLGSIFFIVGNLAARSSNLLTLLSNMSYLWMLLSPVLCMRLLTNEKKNGDQLLFSSPVSLTGVVLGKFFAACTVLFITVLISFVYPLLVALYGTLYVAETLVGYLGFVLMGCAFLALDMLVSCFARTSVVAAIACFGVNLAVWLSDLLAQAINVTFISDALSFISLYERVSPFLSGQLSLANALFDLSFMAVMLFLCIRVLDARRWSEA